MHTLRHRAPALPILGLAALLGIAVFAITQLGYVWVALQAPPHYVPTGLLSLAMDIDSYFSFIHQAADGHWLFRNNMTHEACGRVFFNLQWLIAGKCMGAFHWTPLVTFTAWRFVGSIALLVGFAMLAIAVLPRTWQRVTALLMFAFGGGFGWFMAVLGSLGILNTSRDWGLKNPAIDLIACIHPFAQILKNPHYSLPHGTFLVFLTLYAIGERTRRAPWYAAAAFMAVVQGLFRPYDLITICGAIPLFIAVEVVLARNLDLRRNLLRALPAIASVPLFVYYFYVFSIHPVFKYWASQGDQPPAPIHWHTLGIGLAAVLFAWRLIEVPKVPLTGPVERLLVSLAATIFFLFHGNHITRLLSFSPQIGIPLLAPLVLIGVPMLPEVARRCRVHGQSARVTALAGFLAVNAMASPLYLYWNANIGAARGRNYLKEGELGAIQWLTAHTTRDDVVLSTELLGNRIGFYVPVRVALGHWALTPNIKMLKKKYDRFCAGGLSRVKAQEFLDEIRPRYFCVSEPGNAAPMYFFNRLRDVTPVFSNEDVAIYEVGEATGAAVVPPS